MKHMNILKKLAIVSIASVLVLAGCSNEFTGSDVDTSALATRYSAARTNVDGLLDAPVTTTFYNNGTPGALAKAANQVVQFTFDAADAIDMATVASAITVRNLTAGADAFTVYGQGTAIATTVKTIDGDSVYLSMDLTSASDSIEFQVNSTVLTGKNGTLRLDQDGDNIPGEGADDDIYFTYPIVAGLVGADRDSRFGVSLNSAAFSYNGTPSPITLGTYNRFRVNFGEYQYDNSNYATLLNSIIIIETYNATADRWDPVTVTPTYDVATGQYTADFTGLAEGTVVRARLIKANFKSIKAICGFTQSYDMSNTAVNEAILVAPLAATDTTQSTLSTGNQDSIFGTAPTVLTDGSSKNVQILIDVSAALGITGANGLDASTITAANIKLYDTTDKAFIPFTVTSRVNPAAATTTTAITQIILTLTNTSYVKSTNGHTLYVGPGLKTKGDTTPGVYARKFGNPTALNSIPELRGFYGVSLGTTF
jgi:hypothetical protein